MCSSDLAAHAVLGQTLCLQGDYATARTHLEHGIALIDPAVERTLVLSHGFAPGVMCLAYTALALWSLGFPAQAVERAQEALALAQELAHPLSLAMAQQWIAFLYARRREIPVVQALADALLTLATTQGFPHYTGIGMYIRGWALAAQGQGAAGIAQMQQVVMAAGFASRQPQTILLIPLAEALGHAGQVADGLRLLAEALTGIAVMGADDLLADAYRLQGELLLRQAIPEVAQAEACFQQALAVARRQQAKAWELRAAISLSRLWQQQGKRDAARQLLAPIYEWYTEGFDTTDLQEARTLLEELA